MEDAMTQQLQAVEEALGFSRQQTLAVPMGTLSEDDERVVPALLQAELIKREYEAYFAETYPD